VNQRLLERLEAVNAVLRSSVMELVLQIQAVRDAFGHPQSEIQPNRYYRPSGLGDDLVWPSVRDGIISTLRFLRRQLDQWARRWRCRNCTRHEIERRPDKALGARFRFTVPNFPIARTARYGIATLS